MDLRENRLLQSWDSLTVDMRHGFIDYSDRTGILIAVSTTPVVPMARVPRLKEGGIITKWACSRYEQRADGCVVD